MSPVARSDEGTGLVGGRNYQRVALRGGQTGGFQHLLGSSGHPPKRSTRKVSLKDSKSGAVDETSDQQPAGRLNGLNAILD